MCLGCSHLVGCCISVEHCGKCLEFYQGQILATAWRPSLYCCPSLLLRCICRSCISASSQINRALFHCCWRCSCLVFWRSRSVWSGRCWFEPLWMSWQGLRGSPCHSQGSHHGCSEGNSLEKAAAETWLSLYGCVWRSASYSRELQGCTRARSFSLIIIGDAELWGSFHSAFLGSVFLKTHEYCIILLTFYWNAPTQCLNIK